MFRSRVTQKGQTTIPVAFRRKYRLRAGSTVVFRETGEGILIEPLPDISDSGGSLAEYGDAGEIVSETVKGRQEPFR